MSRRTLAGTTIEADEAVDFVAWQGTGPLSIVAIDVFACPRPPVPWQAISAGVWRLESPAEVLVFTPPTHLWFSKAAAPPAITTRTRMIPYLRISNRGPSP